MISVGAACWTIETGGTTARSDILRKLIRGPSHFVNTKEEIHTQHMFKCTTRRFVEYEKRVDEGYQSRLYK